MGSLLDLVLMSGVSLLSSISSLPPIGRSDHVVIQCCLKISPKVLPPATRLRRVWKSDGVDFEKVNRLLSNLDWSSVSTAPSVDAAWLSFRWSRSTCPLR